MKLPTPYYDHDGITIYHGDCRHILPMLGRFDCVLTDPPYGKVKGEFDNEWKQRKHMLEDCKEWLNLIVPTMKSNATLWWFAWPSLAGRIESIIAEKLNPLAHVVWKKPAPHAQKHSPKILRSPAHESERILMAEHYGSDNMALGESGYAAECDKAKGMVFEPIRAYLAEEFQALGWNGDKLNEICGTASMAGRHYTARSQWCLPTEEHYKKLQAAANGRLRKDYEELRKDYEELRKDYEELRKDYEELRRYFELDPRDPKTELWNFPCSGPSERLGHPTTKPLALIQFMVRISVRPGGTIIDPFAGSGTTGHAAKNLGRKCVMIEREERYCEIAASRLAQDVLPFWDKQATEQLA
jgi:site-specific DNA-methyltransferase (adenine-specific)